MPVGKWLRNDRNKLLFTLGLILAGSFAGVSFFNYWVTRDAVHREIVLNGLPLTRDNIYSELSSELVKPMMISSSMATDAFLVDWVLDGERDIGKIRRYLKGIHERYGFFSTFFVSASTRRYYHFKGLHKIIREDDDHDVWFFNFAGSGKEYRLEVDVNEAADNVLTIFMNFRVTEPGGGFLGVAGVGLEMDQVAEMVEAYQEKYDRSIYLVDPAGVIQVHSDPDMVQRDLSFQLGDEAPPMDELLGVGGEPANFQFERRGRDILLTVRYMSELKWLIFVEQDETKALASARRNFVRTVLVGLAASVCILLVTLVAVNGYQRKVESVAVRDELTGIINRRGLEQELQRAIYAWRRYERPCSLILMDLDGFKRVNDELGHLAGDKVLVEVARRIGEAIRYNDVLARWGGDELVVLTENDLEAAGLLAERLRREIFEADLAGAGAAAEDPRRKVTLCCGVADYRKDDGADSLLRRADRAMYQCKARGGNAVALALE